MPELTLNDICQYRNENILSADLSNNVYISTETMKPNREGISYSDIITPTTKKVKAFYPGDILVSNIRPYFKKIWRATFAGRCSNDVLVFSPKCNSEYLYWLLSTDSFFNYMMATSKGTKMPRGDKKAIMKYIVPDHSDKEQRQIASFLNPLQNKIALNNRINDYLTELLNTLFAKSLENVSDWTEATLLDIANYKNGLAMQKFRPERDDPGLPVLKIKELGQGSCAADAERCCSNIDESVRVYDGDLIFSWSGTLLLDFWAGGDAGLNQHLFKVTSGKYPSWLYYMWTKYHMRRFISLAKDRATTMGHIKRSALAEAKVLIPPADSLPELTQQMQPIVDQIIANKIEARRLGKLRDTLLPKLLSEEIDVSRVDITQLNNHLSDCLYESSQKQNQQ